MATKTFKGRIQNKHDTEANWNAAVNFKPLAGELIIYDEDNTHSTPRFKVGDGSTLVSDLPFVSADFAKLNEENNFTDTNIFTSKSYFGYKTYLGTPDDNVAELSFKNYTTDAPMPEQAYIRTAIQAGAEYNGRPTIDFVNTEGGSSRDMIALTKWDKSNEHYYRTALENFVSPNPGNTGGHAAVIAHYELGELGGTVAPINEYRAKFPLRSGTVAFTSDLPVANSGTGTTALTSLKIDDTIYTIPSGDVTAAGDNTFTGTANTFTNQVNLQGLVRIGKGNSITILSSTSTGLINVKLPSKKGTLALTDDLPVANSGTGTTALTSLKIGDTIYSIPQGDVTAAGNNTFTGPNTFKTTEAGNLYRTLINKNGVSVGGGPGSIVLDVTYGLDNIKRLYGGTTYTYTFPNKNGIFATMNDIPNVASLAKLAQDNTFTGSNTFNNGGFKVNSSSGIEALNIDPLNSSGTGHTGMTTLKSAIDQYCSIELGAGTLSINSKGTNNNTGHIDISTGSNGVDFNIAGVTSAFKVLSDGINVNSKTKYCGGKIDNIVSGTTYSLTLPSKSGTLALTDDIPIKSATLNGTTLSITLS